MAKVNLFDTITTRIPIAIGSGATDLLKWISGVDSNLNSIKEISWMEPRGSLTKDSLNLWCRLGC